jgi:hypothetical protein
MPMTRFTTPFALKPAGIGELTDGAAPAFSTTALDALNEYVDFVGQVVWDSYAGTKTIDTTGSSAIVFRTGTVTTWTTATLTISIQDVGGTTGNPPRGDGGADVSTTFIAGTDALASNTVYTKAFTAGTKNIASGTLVAIRFQLTAHTTANIQIASKNGARSSFPIVVDAIPTAAIKAAIPNVMLIASDGTVGWLQNAGFVNTLTTRSIDSGANPDEYGNVFQLPFDAEICGLQHFTRGVTATGAGVLFSLYTNMATPATQTSYTLDPHHWPGTTAATSYWVHTLMFPSAITIPANTDFALLMRPTDATSDIELIEHIFGSYANALKALQSPFSKVKTGTREGGTGAITEVNDSIMTVWPVVSGIDYAPVTVGGRGSRMHLRC